MLHRLLIAVVVSAGLAGESVAQTAAPPAATPAVTAPSVANVPRTRDGKPRSKELRAACRAEADAKGLKGRERSDAAIACFRKERPDLAKRFDCRKEAKAKGLSGKDLSAAVTTCSKT
jgi:hypothetical protein